jgi:hypothetical protein
VPSCTTISPTTLATAVPSSCWMTPHSSSRLPRTADSTSTFGSNSRAFSIAGSSSSQASTIITPELEPARAGLTNTGSPSACTRASTRDRSPSQSRGCTVTYGICGSPDAANTVLVNGLSMATELASTPAPT